MKNKYHHTFLYGGVVLAVLKLRTKNLLLSQVKLAGNVCNRFYRGRHERFLNTIECNCYILYFNSLIINHNNRIQQSTQQSQIN